MMCACTASAWENGFAVLQLGGACSASAWENGFVTASTRSFGTYEIVADTTAPSIRPQNFANGADMSRRSEMRVRLRDNFSGIQSYEGRIDGRWVLFEHDPKNALLTYRFDDRVGSGNHELVLRATDWKDNTATYRAVFTR